MSEELRFFLRTALYTALVATIYWFVSYEWAGTFLLGALGISAVVFVIVLGAFVPRARRFPGEGSETAERPPPETPTRGRVRPSRVSRLGDVGTMLRRNVGFADHPDDRLGGPMQLEDDLFPTASIWPVVTALGCTMIALGLVFGPWLWVPGAGLFLAAGASWLTQLNP